MTCLDYRFAFCLLLSACAVAMQELHVSPLPMLLRTESNQRLVQRFGDDKQGNLLSITRNAIYDVGNEHGAERADLKQSCEIDVLDVIKKGVLHQKEYYGKKPFVGGEGNTVLTYLPEHESWLVLYRDKHYDETIIFDGVMTALAIDIAEQYAAVGELSESGCTLKLYSLTKDTTDQSIWGFLINWIAFCSTLPSHIVFQGQEKITALAFNNKSTKLCVAQMHNVSIWDMASKELCWKKTIHQLDITHAAFTCDDACVATAGNMTIALTKVLGGQTTHVFGTTWPIQDLASGKSIWGPVIAALGKENSQESQKRTTEVCLWRQPVDTIYHNLLQSVGDQKYVDIIVT